MTGPNAGYVRRFSQVKRRTLRGAVRHLALDALHASAWIAGTLRAGHRRNRVHFLYLHHVFEDEVDGFRTLLEDLASDSAFVTYSRAVELVAQGEPDSVYVTFSFDDGLKSCLRAARLLEEFGASACFFPCVEMVGVEDRSEVARFCRGALDMPPTELLDWDDLETLLKSGHEVGSHSMRHANFAELTASESQEDIEESRDILERRLGRAEHFAWPYGLFSHFSETAAAAVFEAGFKSCASAVRGAHVSASSGRDLCIRRDHLIAGWPARHSRYLVSASSNRSGPETGGWPAGWAV